MSESTNDAKAASETAEPQTDETPRNKVLEEMVIFPAPPELSTCRKGIDVSGGVAENASSKAGQSEERDGRTKIKSATRRKEAADGRPLFREMDIFKEFGEQPEQEGPESK